MYPQGWKQPKGAEANGCLSLGNAISGCRGLDVKTTAVKNALKSSSMPQMMAELSIAFLQQYKDEELQAACKKFFDRLVYWENINTKSCMLPAKNL